MNARSGWWSCYRCKSEGRLPKDLQDEWHDRVPETKQVDEEEREIPLPRGFYPLWRNPGATSYLLAPARAYLEARQVSLEIMRDAGIGAVYEGWYDKSPIRRRIVIPIHDLGGKRVGFAARAWEPEIDPKYWYPPGMLRSRHLFNEQALVSCDRPLFVVEGSFDALALWPDAVACLGKPTDEQIRMLARSRRPKLVALDGDAWRESRALCFKLRAAGSQAEWFHLPPVTDPAVLKRQWFTQEMKMKKQLTGFRCSFFFGGRQVEAYWEESSVGSDNELAIHGLSAEEAIKLLEQVEVRTVDTSGAPAPEAKPNGQGNGQAVAAPPASADPVPAGASAGTKPPKKAKAAAAPPSAEAQRELMAVVADDDDDEEEQKPAASLPRQLTFTFPPELANATQVRTVVQWLMSNQRLTTFEDVWGKVQELVDHVEILKQHTSEELKALVQKRVNKILKGSVAAPVKQELPG